MPNGACLKSAPGPADNENVGTCPDAGNSVEETKATLQALLRTFDQQPGKCRTLIRELLSEDQEAFYAAAIHALKHREESRGYRHLISVLMGRDMLLRALCDRSLGREQAAALLGAALQIDSMADVNLANALASRAESEQTPAHDLARLMEIIGEASKHTRIPPSLRHMVRHPDPYLRSKAVLMLGRDNRSAAWLQNRLAEVDPRIRANAVESLWGYDSNDARELLRSACLDPNNRVAGNAALALYRLGEVAAIAQTVKMAAHDSPLFRASAAWVMGETADPRFAEMLVRMLGDASDMVRKRALAGLQRIKAARTRQSAVWRVAGWLGNGADGRRRLEFAVASEAGNQPAIFPTQVVVSEGGRPVTEFQVEEQVAADLLSVAFVFPEAAPGAPFNEGARRALAWKRPQDLWWAVAYLSQEAEGGTRVSPREATVPFASDAREARDLFDESRERVYFLDLWSAIRRALDPECGPAEGEGRLVVFSQGGCAAPEDYEELAAAATAARISVQAVSLAPDPQLEDLCVKTGGSLRLAPSEVEAPGLVLEAYLNLLTRYAVRYEPASPEAATVKLRIHTPEAWGECQIPIKGN